MYFLGSSSVNISTDVEVLWVSLQNLSLLPENDKLSCCTSHYISGLGYFLQEAFLLILPPLLCQNYDLYINFPFVFLKVDLLLTMNLLCLNLSHKILSVGNSNKSFSVIFHEIANNINTAFDNITHMFSSLTRGSLPLAIQSGLLHTRT